jgi:phytoene synthase
MTREMISEQYCYQKAAAPGSAFFYSISKLPNAQRDTIAALAALYQELNDIAYECHEAALARVKFAWWRNEIANCQTNKSDHPVILTLQKHLETFKLAPQRLIDLLDGIEQNLNLSPFKTFEEVTLHIIHTAGLLELLIAHVQAQTETISSEIIYSLALVTTLTEHIQYLHRDSQRGLVYLADDECEQNAVTKTMLHAKKVTPELKKLLAFQHEKIERAYTNARTDMRNDEKHYCASLLIRAEIARAIFKKIAANGYQVLESHYILTPLRLWWITGKTRVYLLEN